MATGSYQIDPNAVSSITSNVTGLTSHAGSVVSDLGSAVLDGIAFAQIGSAVASANDSLHSQLVNVLGRTVQLLGQINQQVQSASNGYSAADSSVSDGYGGQHNAVDASTQVAQNTPAADPAATANAVAAGQQAVGTHLAPAVVDSIMQHEGTGGSPNGTPEAYGFRQDMHNGYDQIMAARAQYGVGSPEEHQVVSDLLNGEAQRAGALNFTDPGVQAAVMSGAHMRGVAGVQSIMNSMVSGDISRTNTVTPDTVTAINQMTPDQFQQQFHDTRLQYDQTYYGNTITHVNGHAQTWWSAFGTGLTNRYNQEQQQFLGLSNQGTQPAPGPGGN